MKGNVTSENMPLGSLASLSLCVSVSLALFPLSLRVFYWIFMTLFKVFRQPWLPRATG